VTYQKPGKGGKRGGEKSAPWQSKPDLGWKRGLNKAWNRLINCLPVQVKKKERNRGRENHKNLMGLKKRRTKDSHKKKERDENAGLEFKSLKKTKEKGHKDPAWGRKKNPSFHMGKGKTAWGPRRETQKRGGGAQGGERGQIIRKGQPIRSH